MRMMHYDIHAYVEQPQYSAHSSHLNQKKKPNSKLPFPKKSQPIHPPVQQNPEGTEANAYEFQSSGVVGMLETLQDKFVKELRDLQTEETNSVHA